MTFPRKWTCVIVALAAATGLAACGSGDSVNADLIEETIESDYLSENFTQLSELSCDTPDNEVGARFTCEGANQSGVELSIEGELTEVQDGGEFPIFRWKVTESTIGGEAFAESALETVNEDRGTVDSMVCPDEIAVKNDEVVTCTATMDDGSEREAELTFTDDVGGFRSYLHAADPN